MKKQSGFTLIELVVVIVILGILAVTAAPKFLNLQKDARKSALAGLSGAMNGAAGIVYGKSAIEGKDTAPTATVDKINTVFGYPAADGIESAVVGLSDDWTGVATAAAAGTAGTYVATFADSSLTTAAAITNTGCYVTYTEATDADTPYDVEVTDTGC